MWNSDGANEKTEQTFANQALNTLSVYGTRTILSLRTSFLRSFNGTKILTESEVYPLDARSVRELCDVWITDPPYADAVNYEEISEFFLAWYEKALNIHIPGWYTNSKRALAVRGDDVEFRRSMFDSFANLLDNSNENSFQIVMFTHQNASVWADLASILWAAGMRVISAWTIATETHAGIKTGNYVQGTVLLVLRKRSETEPVFLDEIAYQIEGEVKRQLDSMIALEDESDPNFGDADYQLAAYAAALRVLTQGPIHEIDPEKEILRKRAPGEVSPVEQVIRNAVKIACDHLVPRGFDDDLWKRLSPMERFYLKGLEVESHGEYRNGVYQELGRGFGATEYSDLLASTKANQTRLKTASEFGKKSLSGDGFSSTLMRHCLFSIYQTVKEDSTSPGLTWLRTELVDYWGNREKIIQVLDYITALGKVGSMEHWSRDAHAASLLAGAVRNDHV